MKDRFTKIKDALIGLQTQQFLSKNEELQRKNVFINYLHSQISLKATDNPLSSIITRNLNAASNQDSVEDKLTETSNSNAAKIRKHKNPMIKSL